MPASSTAGSPRSPRRKRPSKIGFRVHGIRIEGIKVRAKPPGFHQMQALQRAGKPLALRPGHAIREDGKIVGDGVKNHRATEIPQLQAALDIGQVSMVAQIPANSPRERG